MITSYYHHGGGDILSYALHAVVWDVIREAVHALTRGLSPVALAIIAVLIVAVVFLFGRRRA